MPATGLPVRLARIEPDREYSRTGNSQVALYRPGESLPVAVFPFFFETAVL